jgi:uncharacterized membrane protein YdjX (TVP38/TMEM64 family)
MKQSRQVNGRAPIWVDESIWQRLLLYGCMFFILAGVVAFFCLDRHGDLTRLIHGLGFTGALLAVALMALLCMTPVPSEGLLLVCFRVFGIGWGIFYAWIGLMVGSYGCFVLARGLARPLAVRLISPQRMRLIESWIGDKGPFGLLLVRLLPIPAAVVNYAAGVLRTVGLRPYMWTAGASILPYYAAAALIYLGISNGAWTWGVVGGATLAVVMGAGAVIRRASIRRHAHAERHPT